MTPRRQFLHTLGLSAAGNALSPGSLLAQSKKAARGNSDRHFEIRDIKRTTVNLRNLVDQSVELLSSLAAKHRVEIAVDGQEFAT